MGGRDLTEEKSLLEARAADKRRALPGPARRRSCYIPRVKSVTPFPAQAAAQVSAAAKNRHEEPRTVMAPPERLASSIEAMIARYGS